MDRTDNIIPMMRPSMPDLKEYMDEIKDLWDNRWLTNMGAKHKALESQLIDYLEVPNITLFNNGHFALESVLETFALNGEVITTPFTFASTTHAIVRRHLKPVFCDINFDDYTIDPSKIEALITDKTCAIVPVHVYGHPCQIEAIERLSEMHRLKVIYDAAHAFGVHYKGVGIGCFGDASIFSFHATKVFHTIEGGAVTYRDEELAPILDDIKNFGIKGPEAVAYPGGNGKMNEFQAAIGICNLRHIESEIARRKIVSERYVAQLEGIVGIKLTQIKKDARHNYSYFPIVFDGYNKSRDEVFEELNKNGIMTRKYFYPLTNSFACYKGEFNTDETPVAKYVADRVLTLPLYADLALSDVDRICSIIKN
ncbi:MAG: DegT/DnrJ/EryC1/StrS family aminotransferase [Eubacteriales bacterium]|nr:DegT/DnrJ/EryC1/StrS family aminotransferase [Eubacteriales bacterium]